MMTQSKIEEKQITSALKDCKNFIKYDSAFDYSWILTPNNKESLNAYLCDEYLFFKRKTSTIYEEALQDYTFAEDN